MPSIIPGYVYTFFALTVVSALLIATFSVYAVSMKQDVEVEQLNNLLEYVAAESCELISTSTANNSTITVRLPLPYRVGEKRYWIQFRNDSSSAWVEGGFGTNPVQAFLTVFVPGPVTASGLYTSGYGFAELECQVQGTLTVLNISEVSG
ncbi:MAG: hypothetical protein CW716_04175 [Candidatus Bathyarchaeum sp.]|nr:MAG: hypothetical protein CW716_04175 [Candidatus Bathyarchaeum sp.]